MNKFIFDVDGTLTPSRQKIDKEFEKFFLDFCKNNDVYLVTGSDKDKTVEQVGDVIYNLARRCYNCSGNDVYEHGKGIYTNDWRLPRSARTWLKDKLEESSFPLRTGNHIEERPGMVNFSVVGRNATIGERKLYVEHDEDRDERNIIAELFKKDFPDIEAVVGGETGIDIFPKGYCKSQIVKDFQSDDVLHFFGDRQDPAGNDYSLAKVILDNKLGKCYHVNSWENTWELLKTI